MAKKPYITKVRSKSYRGIRHSGKTYPWVDPKEVAKALGASLVHKIDWLDNSGRSNPDAGKVETVKCGICGAQMDAERNILGATSMAERIAHEKHKHDRFTCPNLEKDWHKRISRLKMDVYLERVDYDDPIGYEQKKKAAEKEILELLKANLK